MNTLVVYAGNQGCTESVAEKMKEDLGENVILINLKKIANPILEEFERVIIGGTVLNGQIQKQVRLFCQKNHDDLLTKELGLFICSVEEGVSIKEQIINVYADELYHAAKSVAVFKSGLDFSRMNFLEKMIARNVKGLSRNTSKIDNEAVRKFSRRMDRIFNPFLFLA